jgi:hypothetical protein
MPHDLTDSRSTNDVGRARIEETARDMVCLRWQ